MAGFSHNSKPEKLFNINYGKEYQNENYSIGEGRPVGELPQSLRVPIVAAEPDILPGKLCKHSHEV